MFFSNLSRPQLMLVSLIALTQIQCATKQSGSLKSSRSYAQPASKSLSYLHYMMGELSNSRNDSQSALEHFRYAAHFDPGSSTLLLRQAEQLLNLEKLEESKSLLNRVTEKDDPEIYLLKSRIATSEFDLEQAASHLSQAEKLYEGEQNPRKVREVLLTRVALLSDYRKYEEALNALDEYLKTYSYDEIGHYFRGKILSVLRRNDEAKEAFEKAIEVRPSFTAAIKALGLRLELEGKVDEAIQAYQQALPQTPDDKMIRQKLANLYLIAENYPAALEHLRYLAKIDPTDSVSQLRTALLYYKTEQYKEAKELFNLILENPAVAHDRVHFYLATMHRELKEFKHAQKHFSKIERDSEYFVESRLQLSEVYLDDLKDKPKSIQVLKDAITLMPDRKEFYLALAGIHERQKALTEAIRVLDQATKLVPNDERVLFVLGSLLDKAGQFEAGIDRMHEVLAINPNNAYALNHIGYVYAEKKIHLDKAETLLKRAAQLAPENGFILDSLGWLYYQRGDYKKARQFLERAVAITETEPVILEHLADTYRKLGFKKQALEVYQRVMRLSANESNEQEPYIEVQKRLRNKIASIDRDDAL